MYSGGLRHDSSCTSRCLKNAVRCGGALNIKVKGGGQERPLRMTAAKADSLNGGLNAALKRRSSTSLHASVLDASMKLVQEVLAIQGVALGGAEAGVADYAAQFFFGGAVGYTCGSYYIFF
jgi:hypothetical protein